MKPNPALSSMALSRGCTYSWPIPVKPDEEVDTPSVSSRRPTNASLCATGAISSRDDNHSEFPAVYRDPFASMPAKVPKRWGIVFIYQMPHTPFEARRMNLAS